MSEDGRTEYRLDVTGRALIRYEGPSGLTRERVVEDRPIRVPELPTVLSEGPVVVEIEEVEI